MKSNPPLVEEMVDPTVQLQPNGIDLTLHQVREFKGPGSIGFANSDRTIAEVEPVEFDSRGWVKLGKGCYSIVYNEIVNIPSNFIAIAKPRSSLLRSGVSVETAVWDAGYSGRSESLLIVSNELGFRVRKNARLVQLIFFEMARSTSKTYSGIFQGEGINSEHHSSPSP
jgi:dUTP pyrophosphatase